MIWGGIGEGSVETSPLCFCMMWGHARIQEFLCQKTALTTFLVLNFTEGAQWLFQTKLYMYIFFFFFWGGGGGGPNANFYRNPYSLWFSRGVRTPNPLWIRAWGDCACAHAHLLSLRCLQMRQVHGCVLSRETLAMSKWSIVIVHTSLHLRKPRVLTPLRSWS